LTALNKKELRNTFRLKRDKLSIEEKEKFDRVINKKLIHLVEHSQYKNFHVFLPMRSEPNIFPFINYLLEKRLNVVCPKSLPNGIMENYPLKSLSELNQGIYGTSYPANTEIYNKSFDLIVIPGLAYSKMGDRLGYGGGYYDRFLLNHSNAIKVAPAYDFQIIKRLPIQEHDIKMDLLIAPNSF
jgi:5-formyltetrahydrofolate cyclo-ligase